MDIHQKYMKRCLELAKKGLGITRPNPSVGSVIVYEDTVIGEGFTSIYGDNHAEVNAIESVKDNSLLKDATIYVSIEPCSHFGKTPPCTDLIVKNRIPNIVIGCIDTHSKVSGSGIRRLIDSDCSVITGILEKECLEQHKRFFTVQNKKRPYIILKWAETKDGFIAPDKKHKNRPVFISNSQSQQLVHKWRSQEHAILVGTNTAIVDNPKLDVRLWSGNNPIRVVLDRYLRIPESYSLFDGSTTTLVIKDLSTFNKNKILNNVIFKEIYFQKKIVKQICSILNEENIQSIIIEGGSQILQSFIDSDLWDEARVFVGDVFFEKGVEAPSITKEIVVEKNYGSTKLLMYKNPSQAI